MSIRGFVEVEGGRLQWDCMGEGRPVVFLHGFTFDRRLWDPQVTALAPHARAVRYDLRGFGSSTAPIGPYRHIDDLRELLSRLNLERPVLVGLSLGANIALPYAIKHPETVAGLILASPGLPGYPWSVQRPVEAVADYAMSHDVEQTKQFWLGHPTFASLSRYPVARIVVEDMVRDYSGWHWRSTDLQQSGPDIRGGLPGLHVPTLVISGDLDVAGYREIAAVIATTVPKARLLRYPEGGHVMNLEQPERFSADVLEFVRGLGP
jgi:pimeloyl-ACP methyl ester carboxylesterase